MKLFSIKILFIILLFNPLVVQALEKVTLQLKWTHAFQFAGYYAAVEKGFYKEAGLDVTILQAGPGMDPVEKVLNGDAHFGVGTSSLLLSRQSGKPLKVLAVIFQHSSQVLITNPLTAREGLDKLNTKRIMIEPHADEILAYLKKQNTPLEKLKFLEHSFDPQDLIEKRIDAMSAYVTYETWFLDKAGLNYNVFTPRSSGIDFYGDNLFTSEKLLTENVKLVEKFRDASLKGWKYAMSNIDETAQLIYSKYSDKLPVEFYKYEAHRMEELMQPELIEIGYMNTSRWQHIADTYIDLGLLSKDFNYMELIYSRDYKTELSQAYKFASIVIVLLILVGFIVLYIYRINIKLKNSEESFRSLFDSLEEAVYVQDKKGMFLAVNDGAVKMYERPKEWFFGKTPLDVSAPDKNDIDAILVILSKVMNGKSQSFEFWGLRADGSIFPKEVHLTRGVWYGKDVVFALAMDISERKQHQIQLEEQNKFIISQSRFAAMGEMIGMIAHQWRQPITVIGMDANNMIMDIELGEFNENSAKEYCNGIVDQVQHLSKTIDDFRNYFKPDKERHKVTIPDILEQTYSIIKNSLVNNNIELKKSYKSESKVDIYPRELMQVFVNIIHNAKDSLLLNHIDNALIEIKVYENKSYVTIDIYDNGGGIDEKVLPKIFDPYFSTKDEKNGTGLGLYMCKMIIENHLHGTIEAFNADNGACIRVMLKKT